MFSGARRYFLWAIVLVALCAAPSRAATITVGTPVSGNCIPFGCPWTLDANQTPITGYQEVYAAGAFGTIQVLITALTFYEQ